MKRRPGREPRDSRTPDGEPTAWARFVPEDSGRVKPYPAALPIRRQPQNAYAEALRARVGQHGVDAEAEQRGIAPGHDEAVAAPRHVLRDLAGGGGAAEQLAAAKDRFGRAVDVAAHRGVIELVQLAKRG